MKTKNPLHEAIEIAFKFSKMLNAIKLDYLEIQVLVNRLHELKQQNLTFDIHFHDSENCNSKGFEMTLEEAKNYVEMYNGTKESYFQDYKKGIIQIVCNETEEVVHEEEIF